MSGPSRRVITSLLKRNGNVLPKITHPIEYFKAMSCPIARVYVPVTLPRDANHEDSPCVTDLFFCTMLPPLTQEIPVMIKYSNSVVCSEVFSIRNVCVPLRRIERNAGGSEERRMT